MLSVRRFFHKSVLQLEKSVYLINKSVPQSPNNPNIWSASQNPKNLATTGPRFEQTNWDLQPNPMSAQELISKVPIQKIQARRIACDGGGGSLGHPKVYLNLDGNGPVACGYCGLLFQQDHSHHH